MSSPLPHLVVAIPPTASAIIVVVVVIVVAVVIVVVVAYYPPLRVIYLIVMYIGRRSEGRSVQQRPSIFSVAAMVPGGNDGLPWQWAGRQWHFTAHFDCYLIL